MCRSKYLYLKFSLVLPMVLLSACQTTVEKKTNTTPKPTVVSEFSSPLSNTAALHQKQSQPWWQLSLEEPIINIVEKALKNSPTIKQSLAKVDQALAEFNEAKSDQSWKIELNGNGKLFKSDSVNPTHTRQASLDASLPLDLFGELSDLSNASQYDLANALNELESDRLNLVKTLVSSQIDFIENVLLQRLLKEQITTSNTLFELTKLRFSQGQSSSVDVLQQQDQLATLRQRIPALLYQQRLADNEITSLSGQGINKEVSNDGAITMPIIKTNYAIQNAQALLHTLPSLRSLEMQINAADMRYSSSLKSQLPDINFSSQALIKTASGDLTNLLSLVISAAWTIFDSGENQAISNQKRAYLAQLSHLYIQSWLDAVAKVDSLRAKQLSLVQAITLTRSRIESLEQLVEATTHRYEQGISDYLPVLNALQNIQQQQSSLLSLQADLARTRVELHSAIGFTGNNNE